MDNILGVGQFQPKISRAQSAATVVLSIMLGIAALVALFVQHFVPV